MYLFICNVYIYIHVCELCKYAYAVFKNGILDMLALCARVPLSFPGFWPQLICIYIHIYKYNVFTHTYMYAYMYIYIYIYVHRDIYIYTNICKYIHICICMCMCENTHCVQNLAAWSRALVTRQCFIRHWGREREEKQEETINALIHGNRMCGRATHCNT